MPVAGAAQVQPSSRPETPHFFSPHASAGSSLCPHASPGLSTLHLYIQHCTPTLPSSQPHACLHGELGRHTMGQRACYSSQGGLAHRIAVNTKEVARGAVGMDVKELATKVYIRVCGCPSATRGHVWTSEKFMYCSPAMYLLCLQRRVAAMCCMDVLATVARTAGRPPGTAGSTATAHPQVVCLLVCPGSTAAGTPPSSGKASTDVSNI